jgi:flagellar basal body L-ring protein FlgH
MYCHSAMLAMLAMLAIEKNRSGLFKRSPIPDIIAIMITKNTNSSFSKNNSQHSQQNAKSRSQSSFSRWRFHPKK